MCVAKYYPGKPLPKMEGFKNILIHTKGTNLGGDLSPYVLKNDKGHLIENIWQFSKVYPVVYKQRIPLSRYTPGKIIWQYKEEKHFLKGEITPQYWEWRKKGMENEYAVRYPNGFHGRKNCLFSFAQDENGIWKKLNYIEARKNIYCKEYIKYAPHTPHFKKLKEMLNNGQNLQLVEVDGPNPTLDYYPYNLISKENPGLIINDKKIIKTLLNDERTPFGHGYCVATLLLGKEKWLK